MFPKRDAPRLRPKNRALQTPPKRGARVGLGVRERPRTAAARSAMAARTGFGLGIPLIRNSSADTRAARRAFAAARGAPLPGFN